MISGFLKGALFALKFVAFITVICLFACILLLLTLLLMSNQKPEQKDNVNKLILALPLITERRHNGTEKIINDILITPPSKQIKAVAKQVIKPPSKPTKKQQPKSIKLPMYQPTKPLASMTSKELLAYAKKEKIKGYTSIYKTHKKLGLIKLIEQQPVFSAEFSE